MKSEESKLEGMEMTPEQFVAMKLTRKIGLEIKTQYPEVANDYRGGLFASQIVDKYNLDIVYHISKYTARKAVSCAIRGFEGGMGIEAYSGLIEDKKDLEMLAQEHRQEGGNESGKRAYRECFGLYGLTLEERYLQGKKGGRKVTELRGLTVWENGEEERVAELMENESFRKQWGERRCPDIEKIQRQINLEFHYEREIRSISALKNIFNKIREKK